MPFLGNSEAITIGEGVPVPMRLRFDTLPEAERPQSNSAPFSEQWRTAEDDTRVALARVVEGLRRRLPGQAA